MFAPTGTSTSSQGFRVTLKRADSGQNLTRLDRLRRGLDRDNARLRNLPEAAGDVSTPVVFDQYEFLFDLAIGTPPVTFSAILDTGSDLIWTQCAPCVNCYPQNTPIFDPARSSSFSKLPCSNRFCSFFANPCGNDGACNYVYPYFDESVTKGVLATETLSFGGAGGGKLPGIAFGCGRDNTGDLNLGGGLVGLGRGPLSLVSQLKEPRFAYCLPSVDIPNARGTLTLGSLAGLGNGAALAKTTRLLRNLQKPTFYYLAFQGISVGGTRLPIDPSVFAIQVDGSGGLVIDSGTTYMRLRQPAFNVVKEAFKARVGLPADESRSTGLSLCFVTEGNSAIRVPSLVLHFEGADVELPKENYMVEIPGRACLGILGNTALSILGNVQQQNFVVLHDLVEGTVSFLPSKCR
ncbi:unnamed protein product [Linum tenue]|uniref:Peptidase A1 domain-containing protein n=1 Tax=Linum tenue TaxID=586396 RepID=A0AAV0PVJ9_9ROSI|nr:unnamed protein product [Linum tenue]